MRKSLYLALTLCAASCGLPHLTGTAFGATTIKVPLTSDGGSGRSGGTTLTPAERVVYGLLTGSVLAVGGLALVRSRSRPQIRSRCCNHED
jgi:hypothetical protein